MSARLRAAFLVMGRHMGSVARTALMRTASVEVGRWAARAHARRASGAASNLPSPCWVMSAAAVAMSATAVILCVFRDWMLQVLEWPMSTMWPVGVVVSMTASRSRASCPRVLRRARPRPERPCPRWS